MSASPVSASLHAGEFWLAQAREALFARQLRLSIELFTRAEWEGASADECAAGRWEAWALAGDFERAWQESDAIQARGAPDPNRFWDGTDCSGKTVILRCLHGYGDAIQFIRYAPLLRRRARRLIVETHPKLVDLFRNSDVAEEVITWGEAAPSGPPAWEQQIEIMELPYFFRTTAASIPRACPYLLPTSADWQAAATFLCGSRRPRAGIAWAASEWNPERSVPVGEIAPLLREKCSWFNLQWEPQTQELDRELRQPIPALTTFASGIADTAAFLAQLDLVITVDSMVAHLAGALGVRAWVLLPFCADWRWGVERDDSPWYPTLRLFRQPAPGEWRSVIARVRTELREFLDANESYR